MLATRGLSFQGLLKNQMVHALDAHDVANNTNMPNPTTNAQLNDLQIRLRDDVIMHVQGRVALTDIWTDSEELRFQFALVTTLVHEVVHQFWWFRTRSCWQCTHPSPWWNRTDSLRRFATNPELGYSWEMWALGHSIPAPGKLDMVPRQGPPNIFSRSEWSSICRANGGGNGYQALPSILAYNYILPVEYISDWFQQAT
jgi:hypothetical protein